MLRFLRKLTLAHLRRHRLESLLCLVGIVLGVAVVVAIDSAVLACVGSFRGAVNTLAERSTHAIFATDGSVPDELFLELRRTNPHLAMAPIIDRGVLIGSANAEPILGRLVGIDVFSERSLRSTTQVRSALDADGFSSFMTVPGEVVLCDPLAQRLHAHAGDTLTLTVGGRRVPVHLAGIMLLEGVARAQLSDLIFADLSTAQELTDSIGTLDRIDLRLEDELGTRRLSALLPTGFQIQSTSQQASSLSDLIGSYKLNLNALSLMASFVAVFIVYNSMLISVQQRATSLGILRCLGASRAQLVSMVLYEALALSLLGGVLGVLTGWALSRGLVHQVAATINDLYASVRPPAVPLEWSAFAKGMTVSLASGLIGAALPLYQASRAPPINVFAGTSRAAQSRKSAWILSLAGAGMLALSVAVDLIPGKSAIIGFVMAFLVAIGFAFICPALTRICCASAEKIARKRQALWLQMAATGVGRSLRITGIAVAAMMLAMSMSIGVRTMVSSFRGALSQWVDRRFAEDVFIGPELMVKHHIESGIDQNVVDWVRQQPETEKIIPYRARTIPWAGKPILLSATDVGWLLRSRALSIKRAGVGTAFNPVSDVLISEPLAGRTHLGSGGRLTMQTPTGSRSFRIYAVFYDFGNERGNVMLDTGAYRAAWNDPSLTSVHVKLFTGADAEKIAARWSSQLRTDYPVVVNSFKSLKHEVMTVFDRTFRVTDVLNWLAGGVAFCGLAGALLALALARRRDYSVLSAVGMSARQTAAWVIGQGMLIAWTSALAAGIAGTALAYVLSYVIQYRSFGWSIPTSPQPRFWLEALASATGAALVASIYPIVRLRRQSPAQNLRQE